MRERSHAGLGEKLRRDQTRGVETRRRCDALWVVLAALLGVSAAAGGQTAGARASDDLPDAPSARMSQATDKERGQDSQVQVSSSDGNVRPEDAAIAQAARLRRCRDSDYPKEKMPLQGPPPCLPENPISPFVTAVNVPPLTSHQKGILALRDFMDPFNFVTIAGYSAIAVATNAHSPYGAGFTGFAKLTGYGLVEDAQGEFFQTYAIPSLVHQDPRYHRMPTASVKRRIWHAIAHTYVARHDDGRAMPNFATLLTYPISAELSNLYVPGIQTYGSATARRVAIGIASDPAGALVAEFLPDVARHIHIHIQFVQELVNAAMVGAPSVQ
ncbi:MAG TPA: hypothetical protein VGU25_01460 [Acidobacteriaceae bacterium]|nr:hypothetical protein [Acidobacteriaceae bacterium]